eukprot:TRINITY_DN3042_c0_g1_i6.p1 TRINITY_DN3042_c0_g1~~TRINITY_DN3042_c0_g1_i6.p1  ORF type:complete len:199 (-),score=7.60 TRINITY_DN3042_c0_g1_i6:135-731(-)
MMITCNCAFLQMDGTLKVIWDSAFVAMLIRSSSCTASYEICALAGLVLAFASRNRAFQLMPCWLVLLPVLVLLVLLLLLLLLLMLVLVLRLRSCSYPMLVVVRALVPISAGGGHVAYGGYSQSCFYAEEWDSEGDLDLAFMATLIWSSSCAASYGKFWYGLGMFPLSSSTLVFVLYGILLTILWYGFGISFTGLDLYA